jgi:hypothetical protein
VKKADKILYIGVPYFNLCEKERET